MYSPVRECICCIVCCLWRILLADWHKEYRDWVQELKRRVTIPLGLVQSKCLRMYLSANSCCCSTQVRARSFACAPCLFSLTFLLWKFLFNLLAQTRHSRLVWGWAGKRVSRQCFISVALLPRQGSLPDYLII